MIAVKNHTTLRLSQMQGRRDHEELQRKKLKAKCNKMKDSVAQEKVALNENTERMLWLDSHLAHSENKFAALLGYYTSKATQITSVQQAKTLEQEVTDLAKKGIHV